MRNLPGIAKKWLIFFVISSVLIGITLDFVFGTKIDYWIHDSAVVYQSRNQWRYAAIVVLDNDIPIQVGRKQALPLFARAAEKAIEAGAKGIFLDARVPKEIEGIMPYALCYETQGKVRWSKPECLSLASNQCELRESSAGHAPLKMKNKVFPFFKMAPYLDDGGNLPDFLLFGWGAENSIPAGGLVAKDRLVRRNSTINRWLDLSEDHAVVQLAKFINAQHVNISLKNDAKEVCDQNRSCRRIRLSQPRYDIEFSTHRPIIPVSRVASCDDNIAKETAALLKNRIVILQLTSPSEATDMLITPMTSAWLGPHLLTPGAQFLADAVETILANDHPRAPSWFLKLAVLLLSAIISVLASAYLKQFWLWSIGLLVLLIMMGLCFLSPLQQLWPVSATMATFAAGWLQVVAIHLLIGFKEGKLISLYMPKQVHHLLLSLKENEIFQSRRHQAIVLMSDMAGYTSMTGILKEPSLILELMNDYLGETSFVLQTKYEGWLETYLGDMVCYYWPFTEKNRSAAYRNALMGALELSQLQKRFFSEVEERYKNKFDVSALHDIRLIVDAGIGLSAGEVVMGDLGPKQGVRKFGILGDPMNLTARIESLTRHFNAEIIVTEDFCWAAHNLGFPHRRLGLFCVKGRKQPVTLYAVGSPDDPRFEKSRVEAWENWLIAMETQAGSNGTCPEIFIKDQMSLTKWMGRGLLQKGIWQLDEK